MSERIVGFCRFSFWGRGDWGAYIGTKPGDPNEKKALQATLAGLYDEVRLEFRFRSFERLTLASLAAQRNRDFTFVVLSSMAMPAIWRQRLQVLCARHPQIRLVFSQETDVGLALAPVLAELSERGRVRLVQFRLDDDDCVAVDYIDRLARAAYAMRDYHAFAFSLPRALMMTRYGDAPPARYDYLRPFHAAGVAFRAPRQDRSIFVFGHYALARRFPAVTDPDIHGSLQLKFEGHDSRPVAASPNNGVTPISTTRVDEILARDFPFLKQSDLLDLAAASCAGG